VLLVESAEMTLHKQMLSTGMRAQAFYERNEFTEHLQILAGLRDAVDGFFKDVMVNAEDAALRQNRLGLLKLLHAQMNQVADLSRLAH
jgi:glycyl-tRNA synthetase beta chain